MGILKIGFCIVIWLLVRLNKKFKNVPKNSNKWNSIKDEIDKIDKKIDEEVYKLYGLTPEEIEMVERI